MNESFINKVEIKGRVGEVYDRSDYYQLSILVCSTSQSIDGMTVIENTWLDCIIAKKDLKGTPDKGDTCHIKGRLRQRDYLGSNGDRRIIYQVVGKEGTVELREP